MRNYFGSALALLAAGTSSAALAQSSTGTNPASATQAPEAKADTVGVADIVVTAQRRSENSQHVPISISSITNEQLVNVGVVDAIDLGRAVPSLSVQYATGTFTPFIRGIGNPIAVAGNEASVASYVDGVYISRVYADFLPLDYVERVEVLKGPQGTLFGRNSSGGLINIVTRTPSMTPTMESSVSYENYDKVRVQAYLSAGKSGVGALSIQGYYENQGKGWGHNIITGDEIFASRRYGFRTKFVSDFSSSTKITLAAGYVNLLSSAPLGSNPYPGTNQGNPPGFPDAVYDPVGRYDVRGNIDPSTRAHSFDAYGRLDQDLGFANLVTITGYRASIIEPRQDYDYTPIDYFTATLHDRERQFTQEVQLLSNHDSSLSWIVGAYYAHLDSAYFPATFTGLQFGNLFAQIYGRQRVNSYSGFGQATLEVMPKLKLTLGGRYTSDNARVDGRTDISDGQGNVLVPGADQTASKRFAKFTYRGAIEYQVTAETLLYGSVSRGFKSGVFGLLPPDYAAVLPEVVDAYEIGLKTSLLDNRVRFNTALFWSHITDPQVILIDNATVRTLNAGGARTRGIEMEIQAAPARWFNLRLSGTYMDAVYTDFPNAPYTTQNRFLVNGMVPGCSVPATGNLDPANGGNVDYCVGSANGNQLPRAPHFSGNAGFDLTMPVGEGRIVLSPNLSYNSGFFWDADNVLKQKPYALLDATLKYVLPGGHATVRVFGRNITNNAYFTYAAQQAGENGSISLPGAPRTYGVALDMKF
jgi:iron complex outermembrane receptor protein